MWNQLLTHLRSSFVELSSQGLVGYKASFVTDTGYLLNKTVAADGVVRTEVTGKKFVRMEVRNGTDSMIALTNPIWLL